jgi:hypothetical protein
LAYQPWATMRWPRSVFVGPGPRCYELNCFRVYRDSLGVPLGAHPQHWLIRECWRRTDPMQVREQLALLVADEVYVLGDPPTWQPNP